jgi:serine/threonine protein kinase
MLQPDSAHSSLLPSGTDDWEIDNSQLKYTSKLANGSFGDLYRGTYCGQDVAIKILKPERLNENLQREFQQEVSIMRWVPFPKFKHLGWETCKIVMCVLSHGD